jgi:hypothetical protein
MDGSEISETSSTAMTPQAEAGGGIANELAMLVHMAAAGLLGAGVVVTYFAIAMWTAGWRADPKYAGMEWQGWMLLSVLGIAVISIIGGIALSVGWLARSRKPREALFWGLGSLVVLALTFAATVATVIDATSYGY